MIARLILGGGLLVALVCAPAGLSRAEIGVQTSVGYTDNINRSELGAESERLAAAVIGGQSSQQGIGVERRVRWEVGAIDYLDDTYDLESLVALDGAADFSLIERRLTWRLEDRLGLVTMNPFAPVTPGGREYVNFFATGPQLTMPLSSSMAFVAGLNRALVQYEEQPIDNARTGALAGVQLGLGPRRTFGVFATSQKYEFDDDDPLNPDYERDQLYVQYETERRRSTIRAAMGVGEISGLGEPLEQPLIELDWQRTVSDYSSFSLSVQRGFFDEGDVFEFGAAVGGSTGVTQAVAGVSNPLDRTAVTALFVMSKERLSATLGLTLRRDEYEGLDSALNRDIPMLNIRLSRQMSPRMRLDLATFLSNQQPLGADTEDEDRRVSVGFAWRVGPRVDLNVSFVRSERSSSIIGSSSEENRAFVTLAYGAPISGLQLGL